MNFISSIMEGIGVIEDMFGSNSKEVKSFHRVLQGYAIKKTKTKKDIQIKFEQITRGQTTDKATNEKIKEILYYMSI